MKTNTLPLAAAFAALFTLSACNSEPETINAGPADPQAEALNNAAPVESVRMIQASRTFRCKDNSLIYADFYTDNTVSVRTEKDGERTVLNATDGKPPFAAEGWSVSDNAGEVSITAPGKGTQSCRV